MADENMSPNEPGGNPLVEIRGGKVIATSLRVADVFGKLHKNVLQAIKRLECSEEFNRLNFQPVEYLDAKGERRSMVEMTRDGWAFLVMGFTGAEAAAWKERYIAQFNAMEGALRSGGDHELAERTNGISRMLAEKVTGVEKLLSDMSARLDQFAALAAAAQPGTALVTTHASANEIAIERGAKQKGRHGLTVRIGNFLELACRDAGEQVLPGRDGKRMFPRSIMMGRVLDYVDALVADHNRALDAQGDLLGTGRRRALAKVAQSEDARLPFLSEMLGSDFDGFLRLHRVEEDAMCPTVRKHGDWLLVRNLREFDGDGLYLIEMGRAGHEYESCFRCDAHPDGYRLIRDNGAYGPPGVLSVEDFRRRVRAKVVFAFTKQDYRWPKAA